MKERKDRINKFIKISICFDRQNLPNEYNNDSAAWEYGKIVISGTEYPFNSIAEMESLFKNILNESNFKILKRNPVVVNGHKGS